MYPKMSEIISTWKKSLGIVGIFVFHALTDGLNEIRGTFVPWVPGFYSLVELTFYKSMFIRLCGLFSPISCRRCKEVACHLDKHAGLQS